MAWHATYNMEPSILDLQSCSVVFFKVLFQAGGGSRREDEDSGEAPFNRIDIERDELDRVAFFLYSWSLTFQVKKNKMAARSKDMIVPY